MKNRRTIMWLLVAILLTGVFHLLLSYNGGVESALLPRTVLLDQPALKATRVTVARRGARPAVLEQSAAWRLVAPYATGIDESTVLRMLDRLRTSEIKSAYSEQELLRLGLTRAKLGLAEPRVTVSVQGEDFATTLLFGALTPVGDEAYAAVEGEAAVYVVSSNLFAAVDIPPEGFRRRGILPAGIEDAQQLDIKQGAGSFMRFAREGGLWNLVQPTNATASATRVTSFLKELSAASAIRFVWPTGEPGEPAVASAGLLAGYGLDAGNAVTVTVRGFDGEDHQVAFGNEKDGLVCALVQNAEAIVGVEAKLKEQAMAGYTSFLDTRLFPFDPEAVARVSIDDAGTTYLLAKGEDGRWLMDSPVAAATDPTTVRALVVRLCALRSEALAKDGLIVSLSTNTAPVTVSRHAVLADLRLENLRSRRILRIEPASVRRIVSTQGGRSTAVVYDRDRGVWNVEASEKPGTVSAPAAADILAALNPLRAEWIVKLKVSAADLRNYGLEHPVRTLAIDLQKADSGRRNILIGDRAQGGRFATLGASDAVFVLSEETIRRLSGELVVSEGRKEGDGPTL
ncbi:MAG: DUF4340 domain-containing protein [Kiritimatiellia bacterium]